MWRMTFADMWGLQMHASRVLVLQKHRQDVPQQRKEYTKNTEDTRPRKPGVPLKTPATGWFLDDTVWRDHRATSLAETAWRAWGGSLCNILLIIMSKSGGGHDAKSKRLLISWLQSPSAVILEPPKIVWHCFHCLPVYFPWSDGPWG